jgi:Low psii accumulation1 / Rep27
MKNFMSANSPSPQQISAAQLERLRAEAKAPFRGLRRFFYGAFAGSAFIGAFVFLLKAIARENLTETLPNLLLQLVIGGLMVLLLQKDSARPAAPDSKSPKS